MDRENAGAITHGSDRATDLLATDQPWIPLRWWRWALLLHLLVLLTIVLLADLGRLPQHLFWPGYDLTGHFVLLGLLAFFLNGALGGRHAFRLGLMPVHLAIPICFGLALVEELSQGLMPARTVTWRDLAADLAGIVTFGWLAVPLVRARRRRQGSDST